MAVDKEYRTVLLVGGPRDGKKVRVDTSTREITMPNPLFLVGRLVEDPRIGIESGYTSYEDAKLFHKDWTTLNIWHPVRRDMDDQTRREMTINLLISGYGRVL